MQGRYILYFIYIIQLSLKKLLRRIQIKVMNEEVEKIWKDNSLIQIEDADGIGRTLAKVGFYGDLYNNSKQAH